VDYDGDTPDIAQGLLILTERIAAAKIPPSKLDGTINLATWNLRELGKKPRRKAALFYIAEILSQFDLVGLVELRDNEQPRPPWSFRAPSGAAPLKRESGRGAVELAV